jgi:hypothetical protein
MARLLKMLGRMAVWRIVATADMTAGPAQTQVDPWRTYPQALSQPSALGVTSRIVSAWVHSSDISVSRCWRGA